MKPGIAIDCHNKCVAKMLVAAVFMPLTRFLPQPEGWQYGWNECIELAQEY